MNNVETNSEQSKLNLPKKDDEHVQNCVGFSCTKNCVAYISLHKIS